MELWVELYPIDLAPSNLKTGVNLACSNPLIKYNSFQITKKIKQKSKERFEFP